MAKLITVLKPFTEQRSGRSYAPGEVVTDKLWHDPDSRRAEAYAARGLVQVEEVADISTEIPAAGVSAAEASLAGRALRKRKGDE